MILVKRLVQLAPAVALALVILSDAKPASAGCFTQLRSCYVVAANEMDWFSMWLSGMNCEFDWAECIRRELVGR
jgi:hypothetical protein